MMQKPQSGDKFQCKSPGVRWGMVTAKIDSRINPEQVEFCVRGSLKQGKNQISTLLRLARRPVQDNNL